MSNNVLFPERAFVLRWHPNPDCWLVVFLQPGDGEQMTESLTDATLVPVGRVSAQMRERLARGRGLQFVLDTAVDDVRWNQFLTPTLFEGIADIDLQSVGRPNGRRARPVLYRDLPSAAGDLVSGLAHFV